MSSRGIVSAKSEIPRNRHHWVIGMLSHLAGSGSVTGFGSPKVTKNAWWYSWSAKVVAGEGANGTVRIPHTIEIALGGRFGNNLVVTLCCKLSQSLFHFHKEILSQTTVGSIGLSELSSDGGVIPKGLSSN